MDIASSFGFGSSARWVDYIIMFCFFIFHEKELVFVPRRSSVFVYHQVVDTRCPDALRTPCLTLLTHPLHTSTLMLMSAR